MDLENQYYNSKALKEDDPKAALSSFQKVYIYSQMVLCLEVWGGGCLFVFNDAISVTFLIAVTKYLTENKDGSIYFCSL